MRLQVITPQGTILDLPVASVTVPGAKGRFTILPHHAPIVSTLAAGEIAYEEEGSGGREGRVAVTAGAVHVADNLIKIIGLCEK